MPHAKLPRKSTNIDMTAMCDVAFLLLTFFMLATKFKPDEPVVVKTPSSISEIILPERNVMLITVDPKGRIFFSIDDTLIESKSARLSLIEEVNYDKGLKLTNDEYYNFKIGPSIGVPFSQLKSFLATPINEQKTLETNASGIPADTSVVNPNNELAEWVKCARTVNPRLRICIKADADVSYPNVQKIVRTLEGLHVYKFNLITNLKAIPPGTAAFADAHK